MKIFRILLPLLLLAAGAVSQTVTQSQAATWSVQRYDLNVTLPSDISRAVVIRANLSVKNISGKPASTLTLRVSPLADVSAVKINDATADFTKNEEKVTAVSSLQRIGIRIPTAAPEGIVRATLDYKLTLKDNTALNSLTPNTAQFLPLSFWYPTPNSWYFARGADEAPFSITVAGTSSDFVTSGERRGKDTAFDQKLRGQPFLLVGDWEMQNLNGVSVRMPRDVGVEGAKRAGELAAIATEARTFVAAVLGKAPDVPLQIVSAHRGAGFGDGGTFVVDEAVFRRQKVDSQTAMNIAEATAKLWLGNSISISGDGYGVISEGLSKYIACQFIESKYGKDVADIERLRQRVAYAAVSKRDSPLSAVSPLDDFYFAEVANKGAMIWRILSKRVGAADFAAILKANMQDGDLNLAELRAAFSSQKDLLDNMFDQVTTTNLLVGLPQTNGTETRVAVRNSGSNDVTVDVAATTVTGEKLVSPISIKATSYGEIAFKSPNKIVRVEIDTDKLYPQIEYSDDVAPRETTDSDPLLATKKNFDKQDYVAAEATARTLLRDLPRCDELRILLGRSLLAQNKTADAEREFRAVLDEKLPTARSIAWANVGLADIASRSNQTSAALKFAETAILADADYGASLAARNIRNKLGQGTAEAAAKSFFSDFDRVVSSKRKSDIDAMIMPGEITRFASGVAGSAETWATQVRHSDRLDADTLLVETEMTVKLLTKNQETGMAVYRLTKTASGWKLSGVDMFEVR